MNLAKSKLATLALPLCFLAFVFTTTAFGLSGAIYTTDSACTGVNVNHFGNKDVVYLDGGPAGGGSGLPAGFYWVKVTEPDGTLLGLSAGAVAQVNSLGKFVSCYQLSNIVLKASDGTPGYDDTTNGGGVYKVWVSPDALFTEQKTDNFKVTSIATPPSTLCVYKFYDQNADGLQQLGEPNIAGWKVSITDNINLIRFTPVCVTVEPDTYAVMEFSANEPNWVHTTPQQVAGIVLVGGGSANVSFGNLCLGPGGGMTLGFWSNKNGQSLENADDFAALTALNLVSANGAAQNFAVGSTTPIVTANRTALNTWLLNASATNMSCMLSAQLAAMKLNVINGKVSGTSLVRTGGCGNTGVGGEYITINDLMASADALLLTNPICLSGHPDRATEECLKNALDDANNNKNFVQPGPCGFTFAP